MILALRRRYKSSWIFARPLANSVLTRVASTGTGVSPPVLGAGAGGGGTGSAGGSSEEVVLCFLLLLFFFLLPPFFLVVAEGLAAGTVADM